MAASVCVWFYVAESRKDALIPWKRSIPQYLHIPDISWFHCFWINFHCITFGVGGKCISFNDLARCLSPITVKNAFIRALFGNGWHSKSQKGLVEIQPKTITCGKCNQKPCPILPSMGLIRAGIIPGWFLVLPCLFPHWVTSPAEKSLAFSTTRVAFLVRCVPNWASKWLMASAFNCCP